MNMTVEEIRKAFEEKGYLMDSLLAMQVCLALNTKPTAGAILEGPPGTGKTFLAETVAEIQGAELLVYQCFPNTREDDLMLKLVPDEKAKSGIKKYEGVVPQAIRSLKRGKRVVLLFDEWDKTRPSADAFLLDFLQKHRVHYGDFREQLTEEEAKNLTVFLTSNAFRDFSEPLLRRLPVIHLHPPSLAVVAKILERSHGDNPYLPSALKIYVAGLKAFAEGGLEKPVTVQELQQLLDAVALLKAQGLAPDWDKLIFTYVTKNYASHEILTQHLRSLSEEDLRKTMDIGGSEDTKSIESEDVAVSRGEIEAMARASEATTDLAPDDDSSLPALKLFREIKEEIKKQKEEMEKRSREIPEEEIENRASILFQTTHEVEQDIASEESFLFKLLARIDEITYEDYLNSVILKDGYTALLRDLRTFLYPDEDAKTREGKIKVLLDVAEEVGAFASSQGSGGNAEVVLGIEASLSSYGTLINEDALSAIRLSINNIIVDTITKEAPSSYEWKAKPLPKGVVLKGEEGDAVTTWLYLTLDQGRLMAELLFNFRRERGNISKALATIHKALGRIFNSTFAYLNDLQKREAESEESEGMKVEIVEVHGNRVGEFVQELLGKDFSKEELKNVELFICERVDELGERRKNAEKIAEDIVRLTKARKLTPEVLLSYMDEKMLEFMSRWQEKAKSAPVQPSGEITGSTISYSSMILPLAVWADDRGNIELVADCSMSNSRTVQGGYDYLLGFLTEQKGALTGLKKAKKSLHLVRNHASEFVGWLKDLLAFKECVFPHDVLPVAADEGFMWKLPLPAFFLPSAEKEESLREIYKKNYCEIYSEYKEEQLKRSIFLPFGRTCRSPSSSSFPKGVENVPRVPVVAFLRNLQKATGNSEHHERFKEIFGWDPLHVEMVTTYTFIETQYDYLLKETNRRIRCLEKDIGKHKQLEVPR